MRRAIVAFLLLTSSAFAQTPPVLVPIASGSKAYRFNDTAAGFSNTGFKLFDNANDHYMTWSVGEDLSANRTFSLILGDNSRTLTLSGNPTLADWFDQSVKTGASPTFVVITATSDSLFNGLTIGRGTGAGITDTAIGRSVMGVADPGVTNCTGVGSGALSAMTSGVSNTAVGASALTAVTSGGSNVAVGDSAFLAATGTLNTAVGSGAMRGLTTGDSNVAIGFQAARRHANGTTTLLTAEHGVYIGSAVRGFNDSDSHAIVIGSGAIGEGNANTVIGTSSNTAAHIFGTLTIGDGTDSTKKATFDASGITTATTRTITLPDAAGTMTLLGNTATGTGSIVRATSPTMTNAIINQAANGDTAIKSLRFTDTSPTGNFLDFQTAAAASVFKVDRFGAPTINITAQASTAERVATFGVSDSATTFTLDNGTTNASTFNPTFNGVIEQTVDGVPVSFFGTKGVDTATNPAILFLGRHNTGGGNTDLSATVPIVEFRNRATTAMYVTGGYNIQLKGGSTSPSLAAAAADTVSVAGVDNGAANREFQVQPEAGGPVAYGNNTLRFIQSANQDTYRAFKTVNTTNNTQTTIHTIPITASRTYLIEARIAARRTGGTAGTADDGASYVRRGTYTTKSGTVTLMGSVQTMGTDAEDQAGWDATFTISSTNVLVRGTGATDNNVTWTADITVQSVGQ